MKQKLCYSDTRNHQPFHYKLITQGKLFQPVVAQAHLRLSHPFQRMQKHLHLTYQHRFSPVARTFLPVHAHIQLDQELGPNGKVPTDNFLLKTQTISTHNMGSLLFIIFQAAEEPKIHIARRGR